MIVTVETKGVTAVAAVAAAVVVVMSSKHFVSILFRYIEIIDISAWANHKSLFRYI